MAYDIKHEIEQIATAKRLVGKTIDVVVGLNQTITTIADCEATTDTGGLGGAWTGGAPAGGTGPTMTAGSSYKRVGTNTIKAAFDNTSLNTYALFTLTTPFNMAGYKYFGFWGSHDSSANTEYNEAGDFTLRMYDSAGTMVLEWENAVDTAFLNAFRLHGDVPHYFEIDLSDSTVSNQSLSDIKTIRFVKTTTEGENAKSFYIDRLEVYQWGTGAGPLRGGQVECFEFGADIDMGLPVSLAADPLLYTLRLGQDNGTTIRGITAEAVDYSVEPKCWVITKGVVNLINQETGNAGEGVQMHGAASNSTGYDVDDGAADGAGSVFAKLDQAAVASGQHPAQLLTGYGTYNA